MTKLSAARQAVYLLGLILGGAATWAAVAGWGTYDPSTGVFDLGPVHIPTLVGWIASVGGNALAAVALWRGWGR
jgi:hypothetical protein